VVNAKTAVEIVDGKTFEADAGMVLVANCGEIVPPFLRIRSGIAYDDGVFDIAVVNAKTAVEIVDVLWRMLTGQGDGHHRFEFARGEVVTVETETPQPAELDGELVGTTPFTARIQPGAMSVVMPKV
jgi:diacylglycerol kinase family enzyme